MSIFKDRETVKIHEKNEKRKGHLSFAKPNGLWDKIDRNSGGRYGKYLRGIAKQYPELSAMEKRIAALVVGLHSSREIAGMLSITEKTVENHRYNIRCKLCVKDPNLETFL